MHSILTNLNKWKPFRWCDRSGLARNFLAKYDLSITIAVPYICSPEPKAVAWISLDADRVEVLRT